MSLLWTKAAAIQREAMPWHDQGHTPSDGQPISVRKSGYHGLVGLHDDEDFGDDEHDEHFDEDAYEDATPEPTHEEAAHHEEHGEYPESFYERHDHAYSQAMDAKKAEDVPDHEDHELGHFVREHAHAGEVWRQHGNFGKINLKQPVYATQSHVHTGHLDRYDANPKDIAWHMQTGGHHNDYPANEDPLFATHEGRLHVVDGHHRVGAALRRGDPHINGWHIDLDHPKNAHLTEPEEW